MTTNSSAKSEAWTAFPVSAVRQPAKDSSTNTRSSKTMLLMCFRLEQRRLFNSPGTKKSSFFLYTCINRNGTVVLWWGFLASRFHPHGKVAFVFSALLGGVIFERPFFFCSANAYFWRRSEEGDMSSAGRSSIWFFSLVVLGPVESAVICRRSVSFSSRLGDQWAEEGEGQDQDVYT